MNSAKLALFICFPATTERYNCDIDISGKFLYNLEIIFPKQEKNTLSRAIDYEGGISRGVGLCGKKIAVLVDIKGYVEQKGCKNGYAMWPIRTAVSGKQNTPGGATEIMEILGKEESLARIRKGIELLSN